MEFQTNDLFRMGILSILMSHASLTDITGITLQWSW